MDELRYIYIKAMVSTTIWDGVDQQAFRQNVNSLAKLGGQRDLSVARRLPPSPLHSETASLEKVDDSLLCPSASNTSWPQTSHTSLRGKRLEIPSQPQVSRRGARACAYTLPQTRKSRNMWRTGCVRFLGSSGNVLAAVSLKMDNMTRKGRADCRKEPYWPDWVCFWSLKR